VWLAYIHTYIYFFMPSKAKPLASVKCMNAIYELFKTFEVSNGVDTGSGQYDKNTSVVFYSEVQNRIFSLFLKILWVKSNVVTWQLKAPGSLGPSVTD
jgi:hypothetical protein